MSSLPATPLVVASRHGVSIQALNSDALRRALQSEIGAPDLFDLARERRRLVFKPFAGFGGRAAYRGGSLTQRIWQKILVEDSIAQALVTPGERVISDQNPAPVLKFDLCDYSCDGQVQSVTARLYQGQTSTVRTPGGGFVPMHEGPA
ncbi:hypothetical protein [Polaromonas sp.]|uniref:hypothetical protein n=1 Tax=Polaromonas sp. TaxID=1869339 RepID=UPI0025CCB23A|nr:hypothetical protein [Polaromonas sp.]